MKCKACGKEISEGMIVDKALNNDYYCDDTCLEKDYTKEQIELMKECSPELDYFECYYTTFEEEETYCHECTSFEEEGFYCNNLDLSLKENCKACICFNKKD